MKPSYKHGGVIWITGLSGAGKTTLARYLISKLKVKPVFLDGDEVRSALGLHNTAYDIEGRKNVALTYSRLCKLIANQGFLVICSTISMYNDVRKWNRNNIDRYLEIFINISEEERRRRDPKGLYQSNQKNIIDNMAGVDYQVELPKNSDIELTTHHSLDESVSIILEYLETA